MHRKKTLAGLALVAILALAAIAAPAAPANNITAGEYAANITLTDTQTKDGSLVRWTFGGGVQRFVECTESNLSTAITKASTALTIAPTYGNCFSNGLPKVPATITMGKCDFVIEPTAKTAGRLTLACEKAGEKITVNVYADAAKHEAKNSLCIYEIFPQGPIAGVAIETTNAGTATEDLLFKLNVIGMKATVGFGTMLNCGANAGAETAFSIKGEYTVTGSAKGSHTPIMVE